MIRQARSNRSGFTLVEAVVSLGITVLAGSAILVGIGAAIQNTDDVLDQTVAAGLAQQLMDEIAGKLYCGDPTQPQQWPLCPNAYELGSACRERYDDIDDYVSFTAQPPKDCWGIALGSDNGAGGLRDPNFRLPSSRMANWRQAAKVYYLNPANLAQALPNGQTSGARAVEVTISRQDATGAWRTLANLRRVFSHVPIP